MMTEFERIVRVKPAFDKRYDYPKKNYGVSSVLILFFLKGEMGAIQFVINTNWFVPTAREHLRQFEHIQRTSLIMKPQGWDVGYHSPKPMYEGHTSMDQECDLVEGGKCYYEGTTLYAEEWIEDFVAGGTEWLWPRMEEEYHTRFPVTKTSQ